MAEWITAEALATLRPTAEQLRTLKMRAWPATTQGINRRASSSGWEGRKAGSSQAWEYNPTSLPRLIRDLLIERASAVVPVATSAALVAADEEPRDIVGQTSHLAGWQRQAMDARAAILTHIDMLSALGTWRQAASLVVKQARDGGLPPDLAQLVPLANTRSGKDGARTLSLRTLYRWADLRSEAAGQAAALAPKHSVTGPIVPEWALSLVSARAVPSKRSLASVVEDLARDGALPAGVKPPSYDQAKRFVRGMHAVDRERGRMGPREIKSIRGFTARDTSELWPLDVVQADGHCFDAEVEHPRHHRAFRPEITTAIDLATRLIVGFSAGLSENALAVSEALIYMVSRWGVPAIWYVDNGSGYNNSFMDGELTGLLGRLGISKSNRLAYNSQAGGYIERSHQTIWVAGAKTLPTYMGAPMDSEARQTVHKLTRADIRRYGRSRTLMTWKEFLDWAEERITAYNNRPHSGLPRVTDPVSGKRRHQTPMEAWQAALDQGWTPSTIPATAIADLTRPYEIRVARRCQVEVLGQTYYHAALEGYHNESVMVGYDIHDASRVWVRDMDGRLICVAEFEANKKSVFPRSYLQKAVEVRAKNREKLLLGHLDEVRAERDGKKVIDITPASADVVALLAKMDDPTPTAPPTPPQPQAVPPTADARFDRWTDIDSRLASGQAVDDGERVWWERYQLSKEFLGLRAMHQAQAAQAQ